MAISYTPRLRSGDPPKFAATPQRWPFSHKNHDIGCCVCIRNEISSATPNSMILLESCGVAGNFGEVIPCAANSLHIAIVGGVCRSRTFRRRTNMQSLNGNHRPFSVLKDLLIQPSNTTGNRHACVVGHQREVTPSPTPPHMPPASAVRTSSVGSDAQLDVPDQIFSTTHSRISAERSG